MKGGIVLLGRYYYLPYEMRGGFYFSGTYGIIYLCLSYDFRHTSSPIIVLYLISDS